MESASDIVSRVSLRCVQTAVTAALAVLLADSPSHITIAETSFGAEPAFAPGTAFAVTTTVTTVRRASTALGRDASAALESPRRASAPGPHWAAEADDIDSPGRTRGGALLKGAVQASARGAATAVARKRAAAATSEALPEENSTVALGPAVPDPPVSSDANCDEPVTATSPSLPIPDHGVMVMARGLMANTTPMMMGKTPPSEAGLALAGLRLRRSINQESSPLASNSLPGPGRGLRSRMRKKGGGREPRVKRVRMSVGGEDSR